MQTSLVRWGTAAALVTASCAACAACSDAGSQEQQLEATDSGEPVSVPPTVPFPDLIALGPGGAGVPTDQVAAMEKSTLVDTRWRVLDPTNVLLPYYEASDLFVSLVFDGERWSVRDCGLEMSAPGTAEGGQVRISGAWEAVLDPDPGASCVFVGNAGGWMEFLEAGPAIASSGDVLLLSRTALTGSWDPGALMPVPVAVTTVPRAVARANDAWTATIRRDGIQYDYQPLASPEDALARAGAVLTGEVTGTAYLRGGQEDRLRVDVEVDEVFAGAPDLGPGDLLSIEFDVNRPSRDQIQQAPEPGGPVLLVLDTWRDGYAPHVDGFWLQGLEGPVNPRAPLAELAPDWTYRDSVEALVHEVRAAAAR